MHRVESGEQGAGRGEGRKVIRVLLPMCQSQLLTSERSNKVTLFTHYLEQAIQCCLPPIKYCDNFRDHNLIEQ